jgi:hypothetical protein
MTVYSTIPNIGALPGSTDAFVSMVPMATTATVVLTTSPAIGSIPSRKYRVLRPIPVLIEMDGDDVVASFSEAGIAMSGNTQTDAMDALAAHIAAVFARYKKEPKLGSWATKQFKLLEQYLGETRKSS